MKELKMIVEKKQRGAVTWGGFDWTCCSFRSTKTQQEADELRWLLQDHLYGLTAQARRMLLSRQNTRYNWWTDREGCFRHHKKSCNYHYLASSIQSLYYSFVYKIYVNRVQAHSVKTQRYSFYSDLHFWEAENNNFSHDWSYQLGVFGRFLKCCLNISI